MSYPTIFAGARAPESIEVTVLVPQGTALDLATVASVELDVYRRPVADNSPRLCLDPRALIQAVPLPSGLEGIQPTTWLTTIKAKGCGKIIVTHAFEDGDDIDIPGVLVIVPRLLLTPSGVLRGAPTDVQVLPFP